MRATAKSAFLYATALFAFRDVVHCPKLNRPGQALYFSLHESYKKHGVKF